MVLRRWTWWVAGLWLLGCSKEPGGPGEPEVPATVPDFAAAAFSRSLQIDNPYWPLSPGVTQTYFGETEEGPEIIIVQVLDQTRLVQQVSARVVRDRVYREGRLVEDTHDWFAQDDAGNVWYLGEEVDDYVYDAQGSLLEVTHDGAWEAGKDVAGAGEVARPGYQMLASPTVGSRYHQEYYPEEAEDMAEVLAVDAAVTLAGRPALRALKTRDFSSADPAIDGHKYYVAGLGMVAETKPDGSDRVELLGRFDEAAPPPPLSSARFTRPRQIDNPYLPWPLGRISSYQVVTPDGLEEVVIEVLDEPRTVAGVDCVVVRDRVSLDGEIQEDTRDFYAQDDAGNVWYLGEEVDNYHYDENGELGEITHEGAWISGEDPLGRGAVARPGIIMPAAPKPGESLRLELYPGVAEDMAYVVRTDATVTAGGVTYSDCLETLEWVPLQPTALERKFYARGIGQVRVEHVGEEEVLEYRPFPLSCGEGGALCVCGTDSGGGCASPAERVDLYTPTFTRPTEVTNPLFPASEVDQTLLMGHVDTEPLHVTYTLLPTTRTISWNGRPVETVQVQYVALIGGLIAEYAVDWYAQADDGSVWYFGEDVFDYEGGRVSSTHGTWLVDRDGPLAMIMPASARVGDVYRVENIPGTVFEEVTITAVNQTCPGPQGPVAGCMTGSQLHVDRALSDKVFAPGYGEFSTAVEGELEALALAVPIDALPTPVPAPLAALYTDAGAVFDAAGAGDWTAAADVVRRMSAGWNGGAAAPVANTFLDRQLSDSLAALDLAVGGRDQEGARSAAAEVALASADLQLRHLSPARTDLLRASGWTRAALAAAEAGDGEVVLSSTRILELIRDRIAHALPAGTLSAIEAELMVLRPAAEAANHPAAQAALERLLAALATASVSG